MSTSTRNRPLSTTALVTSAIVSMVAALGISAPASAAATPQGVASTVGAVADQVEPEFWSATPPPTSYASIDDPDVEGTQDINFAVDNQAVSFGPTNPTTGSIGVAVNGKSMVLTPPSAGGGTFTHLSASTDVQVGTSNHTVVQRQQNRYRSLIQIDGPSAPTIYRWSFGVGSKIQFRQDQNGVVTVIDTQTLQILGGVKPAWAKDANGADVAASYSVSGGTNYELVMTVSHAGAAYPVVADPSISFGWYVYIRYSKSWIRAVWPWAQPVYDKAAFLCAPLGSGWIIAGCAYAMSRYAGSLSGTFQYAYDNYRCVEIRMTYNGIVVGWNTYSC